MPNYLVTWEFDAENVDTMLDAAEYAWEIMRKPGSQANVFTVIDKETRQSEQVDLSAEVECCPRCGRVTRVDDEPVDTDAADGYDGYCGNCADKHESEGKWG